jgi:hypothetical protein
VRKATREQAGQRRKWNGRSDQVAAALFFARIFFARIDVVQLRRFVLELVGGGFVVGLQQLAERSGSLCWMNKKYADDDVLIFVL